jgi:hypothetical protein
MKIEKHFIIWGCNLRNLSHVKRSFMSGAVNDLISSFALQRQILPLSSPQLP